MTQSETSLANRRRRELHDAFDGLAGDVAEQVAGLRAIVIRASGIVDDAPAFQAVGQAAVDLGCEANEAIKSSEPLWDELLDLKRAALGGQESK